MASLLDFLNPNQSGGLLGNFGGSFYNPPQEADAARQAAAVQLASIMGKRQPAPVTPMDAQDPAIGQPDPFNNPFQPANPFALQGPSMLQGGGAPAMPPGQPQAAPSLPQPSQIGPPPGAMPASLPAAQSALQQAPMPPAAASAAAPIVARPSIMGGLNNFIDNNRATLMALAGGIGQGGIGQGFSQAAPIAMAERQYQQGQQNQALTANAIHQGLIAKGHDPREATAIAMASAGNPALAQAVLPELFSNKASGNFKFGDTEIPYDKVNGKIKLLLPGGGPTSLADFIKFGQGVSAQGAATKEAAVETAKTQAAAQQQLPDTLAKTDETLRNIEAIRNHPGKNWATGFIAGAAPAIGGVQADYIGRLNQLKGEAVQQAMSEMRGAGVRFTQREIDSLQTAQARLDRRGDVDSALNDMERVLKGARERAGVKAGVGPTPAPAAPASGGWTVTRVN